MRKLLLLIIVILVTSSHISFGEVQISPKKMFNDGMTAYKNRNYEGAIKLLLEARRNGLNESQERQINNALAAMPDDVKIQYAIALMNE